MEDLRFHVILARYPRPPCRQEIQLLHVLVASLQDTHRQCCPPRYPRIRHRRKWRHRCRVGARGTDPSRWHRLKDRLRRDSSTYWRGMVLPPRMTRRTMTTTNRFPTRNANEMMKKTTTKAIPIATTSMGCPSMNGSARKISEGMKNISNDWVCIKFNPSSPKRNKNVQRRPEQVVVPRDDRQDNVLFLFLLRHRRSTSATTRSSTERPPPPSQEPEEATNYYIPVSSTR